MPSASPPKVSSRNVFTLPTIMFETSPTPSSTSSFTASYTGHIISAAASWQANLDEQEILPEPTQSPAIATSATTPLKLAGSQLSSLVGPGSMGRFSMVENTSCVAD